MGLSPRRPVAAPLATAAVALALVGCADNETAPVPPDVAGPAKRVAAVVERLERSLGARDFETVCGELLTPAARDRAGGRRCAATMAESYGDLEQPRIRPLSIRITGPRAEVRVRSRAVGEPPIEDTLQLERRGREYRISALER